MKIIKIKSLDVENAKEELIRVLTYANGTYALQYLSSQGNPTLDLYDNDGMLIKKGAIAESAYIFKNGNYILLFPPSNNLNEGREDVYCSEYIMYTREGKVIFDDINYFTPLEDDWIALHQKGRLNLYNDKLKLIDGGQRCGFIKFINGYARITPRSMANTETTSLLPQENNKMYANNSLINILMPSIANKHNYLMFDWIFYNEQGKMLYRTPNCLTAFGSGYSITMCYNGRMFFYYPDGTLGTETNLYSGCRKNFACLVNLSETWKTSKIDNITPHLIYRMGYKTEHNVCLPEELQTATDFYEFNNGNFSCVLNGKLSFFKEGFVEPLISVDKNAKIYFAPDGRYWDEFNRTFCTAQGQVIQSNVDGLIDYGEWYVTESNGKQTIYDLSGNLIIADVRVMQKVNSILLVETASGEVMIYHRSGKAILPACKKSAIRVENKAF